MKKASIVISGKIKSFKGDIERLVYMTQIYVYLNYELFGEPNITLIYEWSGVHESYFFNDSNKAILLTAKCKSKLNDIFNENRFSGGRLTIKLPMPTIQDLLDIKEIPSS